LIELHDIRADRSDAALNFNLLEQRSFCAVIECCGPDHKSAKEYNNRIIVVQQRFSERGRRR
jgi:hypothetical protein